MARVKSIAYGYLAAYKRLQDATIKAYGGPQPNQYLEELASEEVFIALFETLNWLDALVDRPEVSPRVEAALGEALKFIRGRVHHQWAEAIEFRHDVPFPTVVTNVQGRSRVVAPPVISDWCWRSADEIPGGRRSGRDKGEAEYRSFLAGRQVRTSLDQIASLAGAQMPGVPTSSGPS
jgi:hypothetical protein